MKKLVLLTATAALLLASCSVRGERRADIYGTMENLIEFSTADRYRDAANLILSFGGDTNSTRIEFLDYGNESDKRMAEFVCSIVKTLVLTHERYEFGRILEEPQSNPARYHLTVFFVKDGEKKPADFSFVYIDGRVGLANFDINW